MPCTDTPSIHTSFMMMLAGVLPFTEYPPSTLVTWPLKLQAMLVYCRGDETAFR